MSKKKKDKSNQVKPKLHFYYLSNLMGSIGISLIAGFIGSFFTVSEIDSWYATLIKPIFNPPNWIFGPVWTLLYILMGIALFLVITSKSDKNSIRVTGYWLFGAQLIMNTLWSLIFFGMKDIGFALFAILILWTLIAYTIYYFNKINKTAAILLIPYIVWVSFATILNFSILMLN